MSPVLRHPFPGPDRAVGRGQEVSLRSVPVYMQRPSAKNGHNGAQDGQRAPSLPGVPDPGKLTTDGPDTSSATHPSGPGCTSLGTFSSSLALGSRPSTSSHRRTHPHPPKQPPSASPALGHPFSVLGEL
ncbi:uncharacterized protein LOC144903626 [Branchiostoma floridae x Branchiostoma belcheri]